MFCHGHEPAIRNRKSRQHEAVQCLAGARATAGGTAKKKEGGALLRTVFLPWARAWPLHNIAITDIVWCMASNGGVGGGAYIAQWPCISIAIGQALHVGKGNERKIDSHNKALE